MKTITRFILVAAMLGSLGFISGCSTPAPKMTRVQRQPAMSFSFRVTESSFDRPMSREELKTMREATLKYLAEQGELVPGTRYYLRVEFSSSQAGVPADWVLVEVLNAVNISGSLVATNQTTSPYYYPGYASADSPGFYPDYFYDPYAYSTGRSYYYPAPVVPPTGYRPHDRDRDDRSHDRDNDRPRDGNRGDRPPGTYAGGDNHDRDRDHRPRTGDYTPRTDDSPRGHDRGSGNREPTTARISDNSGSSGSSGSSGGGGSYSPPPPPTYSEPPPARSESSNTGIQKDSAQTEEK